LSGNVLVVQFTSTTPKDGTQQPIGSLAQLRSVPVPVVSAWSGMNITLRANALLASSYTQCEAVMMTERPLVPSFVTVPEHT